MKPPLAHNLVDPAQPHRVAPDPWSVPVDYWSCPRCDREVPTEGWCGRCSRRARRGAGRRRDLALLVALFLLLQAIVIIFQLAT